MNAGRQKLTCVVLIVFLSAHPAAAEDNLSERLAAYWNFDEGEGNMAGDSSANGLHAKISGATWTKGKFGYALRLGKGRYVAGSNNPKLSVGGPLTVSAWIKPTAYGQQFVVSKHGWNLFLGGPEGEPPLVHVTSRNAANDGWTPMLKSRQGVPLGQWSFIAFVHDPQRKELRIYVNGILSNRQARNENIGGTDTTILAIGRYAGNNSNWFHGLIDEVRIYNRALSNDQIKSLHELNLTSSFRRIKLTTAHLFSRRRVRADVDVRNLLPLSRGVSIAVRLMHAGEANVLQEKLIDPLPESGKQQVEFSTAGLPPGRYEIRASLIGGKEQIEPAVGTFTAASRPAWLGTTEGRSDEVLAPWTPLRVRKERSLAVEMWGRSYHFSDRPRIDQIETLDRAILAGPIRLVAKVGGKPVRWSSPPAELKKETGSHVRIVQRATGSRLALTLCHDIEYDGLIKTKVSIESSNAVRLDELVLEIPLSRQYAKNLYSSPYGLRTWFIYPGKLRPGMLPDEGKVTGYRPTVLWIGDERGGLAWMSDSGLNWYANEPDKATEIIVDDSRVLVRLRMVATPVQLDPQTQAATHPTGLPAMQPASGVSRLDYTFALQATPVKPIEQSAWDRRIASSPWYGEDFSILERRIEGKPAIDYFAEQGVKTIFLLNWTEFFSYTRPVGFEDDLRRFVKAAHERGMKVMPYVGGFLLSERSREWSFLKDEVIGLRSIPDATVRGYFGYHENKQYANRVCYRSVMSDFLVDGIAHLIDEYDIDGVYLDSTVYPSPCLNTLHGCGYIRPDGTVAHVNPIFEIRELLKRIYTVVKTRKPDGVIDAHVPPSMNIAAVSWATSYWAGESLKRTRGPLLESLPLDHFRVEFMGHPWGVPAEFLQYTLLENTPKGFKQACAVSLLHDVPVRAHGTLEYVRINSSLWKLFDRFDRKGAEWHPYWNNAEFVTVEGDGAYASLYRHPKNGTLIVVSKLKQDDAATSIQLQLGKLGLPKDVDATDALTGDAIECEGGRIALALPYLGWRMVWVKKPETARDGM